MENPNDWTPTESWIVLDEDRNNQGKRLREPSTSDSSLSGRHPDSNWLEDTSEDDFNGDGKLTSALSVDVGQDAMFQAEKSLGLAVGLDGIDTEYLQRTNRIIQENTRDSPNSLAGLESESDSADDVAFRTAGITKLKYGGRAPPVLGALAPPVTKTSSSVDFTSTKPDLSCHLHSSRVCKSVMDGRIKSPKRAGGNGTLKKERLGKGERRRSRRRRNQAKKAKWSCYIFGLGHISLHNVVPMVVSHMFTLLVGIYIGRQYRSVMQNRNTSNCQVAHNSTGLQTTSV